MKNTKIYFKRFLAALAIAIFLPVVTITAQTQNSQLPDSTLGKIVSEWINVVNNGCEAKTRN